MPHGKGDGPSGTRHLASGGILKTRRIIGLVLGIIGLPLIFFGLIDPLEGGIALIAGALLGLGAWLVSRVPVPRFTWISLAVSFGLGVLTLLAAVFLRGPASVDSATGDVTVSNPLATVPIAIILLWAYRLSVLVTLAGGIYYLVRISRAVAGVEEGAHAGSRRGLIAIGARIFTALGPGAEPSFPSLEEQPQAQFSGTVAYYSDSSGCVRIIAAAGGPSKDVYCIPDEPIESKEEKGKPIGPHLAWLPAGRLSLTMYRMPDAPGPEVLPGWERIVDVRTGAVEEVPEADVPQTAPVIDHITVSPEGARVTTVSADGAAIISLTQGGQTRVLLDVSGDPRSYRMAPAYWSPDFTWIAADDGRILIIDPTDPATTWIVTDDARTTADERFDRFAITTEEFTIP
jgi:hypothetical protein